MDLSLQLDLVDYIPLSQKYLKQHAPTNAALCIFFSAVLCYQSEHPVT